MPSAASMRNASTTCESTYVQHMHMRTLRARVETAARGNSSAWWGKAEPGCGGIGCIASSSPARARAPPHSHTGPKYYNTSTRYNIVLSCRGASNTARGASTRARARCQVSAIHGCWYSIASTEVWLHPKASCAPSVRRARAAEEIRHMRTSRQQRRPQRASSHLPNSHTGHKISPTQTN